MLIAFLNVDHDVSTNLINPDEPIDLTPHEIAKRTWGSKTVLLVEQCMCAVQWGTKGCLLILYWRLTQNLRQHLVVKLVAIYVVGTYCIMFILYFGVWCRPFSDYWQVPTDNVQCTTALHHLITNLVFNLSSDLMIMAIPLPLLLKQHVVWKKKLLMVFPFTLGAFSMICAILSKYSSFTNPFSVAWVYWYCREASTVMIVTNMPYVWTLIRRIFNLRSFFGDSDRYAVQEAAARHYEGQSVGTRPRTNGSAPRSSRRRSTWLWKRSQAAPAKQDSACSENEMVSRTRTRVKSNAGDDAKSEPNDAASSNTSIGDGMIQTPPPTAQKADAVDRIYKLDDDELERPDGLRRIYSG